MEIPDAFKLVMIPSGSFGFITGIAEARQSLLRIYQYLLPGGRLVLELDQLLEEPASNPEPGENSLARPEGGQIKIRSSGEFDAKEKVYHGTNRYELILQGQTIKSEVEYYNLRYYEPGEFASLLEEFGFKIEILQAAF